MQNHHANKNELKNQLNKLIYMYLPSSHNPKFTNRMLISKINSPRTMNISFKEIEKAKIKNNLQQIKNKNNNKDKDKQIRINLPIKSRGIGSSQGIYSERDGKDKGYSQSNDQYLSLTQRAGVKQMSTLEKWRSLHTSYSTNKNKERKTIISPQKIMQKKVRMSISRMLQNSRDRQSFDFITKFYKNPIQKQLLLKKSKKQGKDICQVLNVSEYRPQTDHGKSRYNKTVQPRCRCHNKSHIADFHRFNNTSYQSRRSQLNYQDLIKPKTSALTQRKILMLNMPQSWTVDSWNTKSKFLQQGNSVTQQTIFHQ